MRGERAFLHDGERNGACGGQGGEVMNLTVLLMSLSYNCCAGLQPSVGGGSGPLGIRYLVPFTRNLCLLHTSCVGYKEECAVSFHSDRAVGSRNEGRIGVEVGRVMIVPFARRRAERSLRRAGRERDVPTGLPKSLYYNCSPCCGPPLGEAAGRSGYRSSARLQGIGLRHTS